MADTAIKRPELAQVLALFPDRAVAVREVFLRDPAFRAICDDYALAVATLTRLKALPEAGERPEIHDYLTVISELETEIASMISHPLGGSRQADPAPKNNMIARRPE